jgi:hypothetical protein
MTYMQKQALYWIATSKTGASSMTMAFFLAWGIDYRYSTHPRDPDDLRRCVEFLDAVPDCRLNLNLISVLSPNWAALVARWDELEALLRRETSEGTCEAPETYALMRQLLAGRGGSVSVQPGKLS